MTVLGTLATHDTPRVLSNTTRHGKNQSGTISVQPQRRVTKCYTYSAIKFNGDTTAASLPQQLPSTSANAPWYKANAWRRSVPRYWCGRCFGFTTRVTPHTTRKADHTQSGNYNHISLATWDSSSANTFSALAMYIATRLIACTLTKSNMRRSSNYNARILVYQFVSTCMTTWLSVNSNTLCLDNLALNAYKTNGTARISNVVICSRLSSSVHSPPNSVPSQCAPQPNNDTSVKSITLS